MSERSPPSSPLAALPARVHLIGAGGAGVSGAALLLRGRGVEVSCADRSESEHTEMLDDRGLPVALGPDAAHLPAEVELLVRSAAVPEADPCVAAARARGLPVLKYSELVGCLSPAGRTLAVSGTHGKTTTAWMLHHALRGLEGAGDAEGDGDRAPGALVGGICRSLGVNAVAPDARGWFAVEACEYDRSFLRLAPRAAAITNVEADHLDYYGSLAAIEEAFARFADRVHPDGVLAIGPQVPLRVEDAARCRVWRLGRELRVQRVSVHEGRHCFALSGPGFHVERVELALPGRFNVDNAALALALAVGVAGPERGREPAQAAARAARGIEAYAGCRRRFEPWGTLGGIEVVHDYAHHPTEVRVTLEAARQAFPGRQLHVLFQPHQYSRTARFLHEFAASLCAADRVVVADVYGARAHVDAGHSAGASELAEELARRAVEAVAGGPLAASMDRFVEGLPASCAALVLGAGDIGRIRDGLFERLALSGTARGAARV